MSDADTLDEEVAEAEDAAPAVPRDVRDDSPAEELLAPLEGDNRVGEMLRYEGTFDRIREARRDEDPALPQGVWETEIKRADWAEVEKLCVAALSKKSKDLHFAVWLTEAWTHREGLPGFRRGLDLTCSLCEEYWSDIHPQVDDDGDLDFRLGPLRWAAEQFPILLRLIPITAPAGGETRPVGLKDLEDVLRIENLRQRDANAAKREQARYPTRAEFEGAVDQTPVEYFIALVPIVDACMGEVERLDLFFEEYCPKDGPSLARIRAVLEDIDQRARTWMEQKGGVLPGDEEDEDTDENPEEGAIDAGTETDAADGAADAAVPTAQEAKDMAQQGAGKAVGQGPIQSRAEAYQRLNEVAEFLVRTEPHSPVPYLIKRAVAWGGMSFGELLVELIEGGGDHHRVLRLLGLDSVGKKPNDK